MYIIDVIPIRKIPRGHPPVLSYFFGTKLPQGAVMIGEIRDHELPMIVIASRPLKEYKATVRTQEFQLKPVKNVLFDTPIFPSHYLSFLKWISDYYFSPISYVVHAATPPAKVFASRSFRNLDFSRIYDRQDPAGSTKEVTQERKVLLWGYDKKSILEKIRNTIIKDQNVLLLAPQAVTINIWADILKRDIQSPIIYRRSVSIKKWVEMYQQITRSSGEIIVGARSALFAPLPNIGLVVVLHEDSPSYHSVDVPPYYHAVSVAEKLAQYTGASLMLSSITPSLESYGAIQDGGMQLEKQEGRGKMSLDIIDIRTNPKGKIVSDLLAVKLKRIIENKKRALVFINRRGHATAVLCRDCGRVFSCDSCELPFVYHVAEDIRTLWCHHCGKKAEPPDICPNCRSHNLDYIGTGIQKVASELTERFPQATTFRLDSDSAAVLKDQKHILDQMVQEEQGAILVATELIFKYEYLFGKFDLAVMANFDQLFHLPDYRIEEKMRRILVLLKEFSTELAVQTYNPDREFLKKISDLRTSYEQELDARRKFFYPPYGQVIRLVHRDRILDRSLAQAKFLHSKIQLEIRNLELDIRVSPPLPCFIPKEKNTYCFEMILRLKKPLTPEEIRKRNEVLKVVPADWEILVDPWKVL